MSSPLSEGTGGVGDVPSSPLAQAKPQIDDNGGKWTDLFVQNRERAHGIQIALLGIRILCRNCSAWVLHLYWKDLECRNPNVSLYLCNGAFLSSLLCLGSPIARGISIGLLRTASLDVFFH